MTVTFGWESPPSPVSASPEEDDGELSSPLEEDGVELLESEYVDRTAAERPPNGSASLRRSAWEPHCCCAVKIVLQRTFLPTSRVTELRRENMLMRR